MIFNESEDVGEFIEKLENRIEDLEEIIDENLVERLSIMTALKRHAYRISIAGIDNNIVHEEEVRALCDFIECLN